MWLYLVGLLLVVVGIVGSLSGGGIFTIILIPLALAALIVAAISSLAGRGHRAASSHTHQPDPLPHQPERPGGKVPTSHEGLVDARRAQQ